ncbi:AraC family transcriptional regulator [Parendozoicomonas sp. Alg238-R29]|uniref:AraC family transcriptional regulator n=1 Tax=Parendozoicomonas sp. Alg238-R29 TaxID=2993446 RepID=UPI00248F3CE1|nr:AraC family transcriptional regulator [Parendozoicomonas sp. Alg238-R29]
MAVIDKNTSFKRSETLPWVEMRCANQSAACYHTHSHDEFSFGVIDAGRAEYRNMKKRNQIAHGSTVTINPGDAHSCNPSAGEWSYRMLFVDTHWIGQLQQDMLKSSVQDYHPFKTQYLNDNHSYLHFHQLFEGLLNEPNPLVAENLLVTYLENLFVDHNRNAPDSKKPDTHRVIRAKEAIMDQLESNVSLEYLAEQTGLSRYHLIRSFKARYGQSPHAFQLDNRIKKAKVLLQRGSNLSDIACDLGFADQSHFQRNFKKRLAMTPKQYQDFFI